MHAFQFDMTGDDATVNPGQAAQLLLALPAKAEAAVALSATVTIEDRSFVHELNDRRWHRCLRCDDWVVAPIPEHPGRKRVDRSRRDPGR